MLYFYQMAVVLRYVFPLWKEQEIYFYRIGGNLGIPGTVYLKKL